MRLPVTAAAAAVLAACVFLACLPPADSIHRYEEPIVCINFDDGFESIHSFAFPCMQSMDTAWAATHFVPVTFVGSPGMVTLDELKEMEAKGWETGGHAFTHVALSALPQDSVEYQVKTSYDFLVKNNLCHASFAYPGGNYTATNESTVSRWFANIRTAHDYLYTDGVNRDDLGYFAVKGGHSVDDLVARVERARSLGAPLVIIGFHAVIPDSAPPIQTYWCRESVFRGFMRYLKDQELPVMTIEKAMTVLEGNRRTP
jgi:hypothetical protein